MTLVTGSLPLLGCGLSPSWLTGPAFSERMERSHKLAQRAGTCRGVILKSVQQVNMHIVSRGKQT